MSLQLEPGQKLTDFQRQYLTDRGIDPDEFQARSADDQEPTGPDEAKSTKASPGWPYPTPEDDEEDVPYSEWEENELQVELRNRELDDSGSKDEMIERLEEHDEANAPEVPPHTPA